MITNNGIPRIYCSRIHQSLKSLPDDHTILIKELFVDDKAVSFSFPISMLFCAINWRKIDTDGVLSFVKMATGTGDKTLQNFMDQLTQEFFQRCSRKSDRRKFKQLLELAATQASGWYFIPARKGQKMSGSIKVCAVAWKFFCDRFEVKMPEILAHSVS